MLLAQIDILKINTPKKKHFPFAIKFLKKVSHVLVSQKIIFEYIR
jgi:predicted dehydrogenase